jgi:hypothetical protein
MTSKCNKCGTVVYQSEGKQCDTDGCPISTSTNITDLSILKDPALIIRDTLADGYSFRHYINKHVNVAIVKLLNGEDVIGEIQANRRDKDTYQVSTAHTMIKGMGKVLYWSLMDLIHPCCLIPDEQLTEDAQRVWDAIHERVGSPAKWCQRCE